MNPHATTPATKTSVPPRHVPNPIPQRHRTSLPRPRQQTIWGFIRNHLPIHSSPREQPNPVPILIPDNTQPTPTPADTPPSTPIPVIPQTFQSTTQQCSTTQQRPLRPERSDEPWGDCWALWQPTNLFRVISKNTGTLNMQNLDMKAITSELMLCSISVFAAQETNVQWNEDTTHLLQTQCRSAAPQTQIATSTSAEKTKEWYKPGGTLALAMNHWTSREVKKGTDMYLGRWSFIEFVGKQDKRLIVMSGYRVCNQPFDAASQTVTAQQSCLLQAKGIIKPKPRKTFLDNLIQQIKTWCSENKELILCMDANDPLDDPKADISRLFQETDMTDLHYHK